MRQAFRQQVSRVQRTSDGTISLAGRRFELPSRYRHLARVTVRYARWDLSRLDLVDPRTEAVLATLYPLDKAAHADGQRRLLKPVALSAPAPSGMAPLLAQLLAEYAATGLPPAYLPLDSESPP